MSKESPLKTNSKMIDNHIKYVLDTFIKNYKVKENDIGDLAVVRIKYLEFHIRQFDVEGMGNLLVMSSKADGPMQMNTITITPYYKNLPMFTADYMYRGDGRSFLNEIYDLVPFKDDFYDGYIRKFAANCKEFDFLDDLKPEPCWYDDMRPVYVFKNTDKSNDKAIMDIYRKNLETFIEMEKASPVLDEKNRKEKWKCNREYARRLVDDGGVSTKMFVESIGAEKTKKLFYSVFFAPDRYE